MRARWGTGGGGGVTPVGGGLFIGRTVPFPCLFVFRPAHSIERSRMFCTCHDGMGGAKNKKGIIGRRGFYKQVTPDGVNGTCGLGPGASTGGTRSAGLRDKT